MPPRIQPRRMQRPSPCQCFWTRPSTTPQPLPEPSQARYFSASESRQRRARTSSTFVNPKMTLLRREMQQWLNGPGKKFLEPLPGSTNYMSAYDDDGNLLRGQQRPEGSRRGPPVLRRDAPETVISEDEEEAFQARQKADGMDDEEIREEFQKRALVRARNAEIAARDGLPKERMSDMRPYPLNRYFRSQPVLSEALRETIYQQVVGRGVDVSTVSAMFSVDIRRVAAVVRLKSVEKQWIAEGKQLAKPYNDAVLAMLPQTPFNPGASAEKLVPHETINDLPVHPKTRQQLFYPVSESRQFTREDAAKAFDEHLLAADKRIPHPELVESEKEALADLPREERYRRIQERDAKATQDKLEAEERRRRWEQRTQRVVPGRRWDFKFQDFSAEKVGKTGRARNAVGARYGMPHEDRKAGMIKIPTSVE